MRGGLRGYMLRVCGCGWKGGWMYIVSSGGWGRIKKGEVGIGGEGEGEGGRGDRCRKE